MSIAEPQNKHFEWLNDVRHAIQLSKQRGKSLRSHDYHMQLFLNPKNQMVKSVEVKMQSRIIVILSWAIVPPISTPKATFPIVNETVGVPVIVPVPQHWCQKHDWRSQVWQHFPYGRIRRESGMSRVRLTLWRLQFL